MQAQTRIMIINEDNKGKEIMNRINAIYPVWGQPTKKQKKELRENIDRIRRKTQRSEKQLVFRKKKYETIMENLYKTL